MEDGVGAKEPEYVVDNNDNVLILFLVEDGVGDVLIKKKGRLRLS